MLHTVASLPGPERSKCLSSLSDGWRHRELLGDGPDKPSQLPGSGHDGDLWRLVAMQQAPEFPPHPVLGLHRVLVSPMPPDAAIASGQPAVFPPNGPKGRSNQRGPKLAVALTGLAALALACALMMARTDPSPTAEMPIRGKRRQVDADLGHDPFNRALVHPRDRIQRLDQGRGRAEVLLDLLAQTCDRLFEVIQRRQELADQKPMMPPKAPGQAARNAGSLARSLLLASSASVSGSVVPCTSASSIARPEPPGYPWRPTPASPPPPPAPSQAAASRGHAPGSGPRDTREVP